MPTTTNYGWTTPADTDLVKDGASAIRTLGNGVDTSLKTVSDGRGLVHINTTTFSAVSSQSVNNVFSSTYENYMLQINALCSTGADFYFRFRSAGTNKTTSYYRNNTAMTPSSATVNGVNATNIGYHFIGYFYSGNTLETASTIQVLSPYSGQRPVIHFQTNGGDYWVSGSGFLADEATNFDGFTLYPSSGTITGSVNVYGYKK